MKASDIKLNDTFGDWTVIENDGKRKIKCMCSCGKVAFVDKYSLVNGASTNCGHARRESKTISNGDKFGYWEVIKYLGDKRYLCKCKCGTIRSVDGGVLRRGFSKSCGCMKHDIFEETMFKRYGDISSRRADNPRETWQIEAVKSKESLIKIIKELREHPTISEISQYLDIIDNWVLKYIHRYGLEDLVDINPIKSKNETTILELLQSKLGSNVEIQHGVRNIIPGKELDIYIPSMKLAFEINGSYWHSSIIKPADYHQEKTVICNKLGIRLVHIYEYEMAQDDKWGKLKNYIESLVSQYKTRIYGRNLVIKEIDAHASKEFISKYHLQGTAPDCIRLGAFHNDSLVGVMTFGTPRFDRSYEYELIRLCWKTDVIAIGGTAKLFSAFVSKYKPISILSYANVSKFTGDTYEKLGFKLLSMTRPGYVWVSNHNAKVLSRYDTQKHTLVSKGLGTLDQTEDEIMEGLGFLKIYDAGNLKFGWTNKTKAEG